MIEIIPNWHPVLVHFTIALVTMAMIFHLIAKIRNGDDPRAEAAIAGRWALIAGALATIVTVAAGFYAYSTVTHDEPAHLAMTDHRNWAVPTAFAILLLAVWSWIDGRRNRAPSWIFIIALIVVAGSLSIVGYKGAELVYRHGLGVMRLPEAAGGSGHHHGVAAHEHGSSDGKDTLTSHENEHEPEHEHGYANGGATAHDHGVDAPPAGGAHDHESGSVTRDPADHAHIEDAPDPAH